MRSRGFLNLCLGTLLAAGGSTLAQDESQGEVPVSIKEVDVTEAIQEFQAFERRLEEYRKAVTDGQKAATDIGEMLADLRRNAKEENDFNEKEILQAINGYVDGVVQKQADLVDFLQSQRYRITYYANRVAASVRSEDIAALFGTQEGNIRRLQNRTRSFKGASKDVAKFIDGLSSREFSRATFQPLPGMTEQKRGKLRQLQLRYQTQKNAVSIAESRLRLVRETARINRSKGGTPEINVDLILSQMFGALDRIRLQMSSDLLYLEAYLARFEKSARTQEIVGALQQLISLQGGMEGPSPGLSNVLDWLEESSVRKLAVDTPEGVGDSFPRTSDLLREAYTKGRGKSAGKGE
jgi:hypothetical protein